MLHEIAAGPAHPEPGRRAGRCARGACGRSRRPSWTSRPRSRATAASCATASTPGSTSLRTISRSGKQVIAEMEEQERARTGIPSLKVRYNRVFGYYIEVSKSNLHAVPADYHRKQTIAGGERYITPELKEYEEKVLGADERILEREVEIFERLRAQVAAHAPRIQDSARARGVARRAGGAGRDGDHRQLHQAARARGRRDPDRRRAPPGRRAALVGGVRPQRHAAQRHDAPAGDPHRAEHGRQVHLPAAGGAHLPAGAGRVVRAGAPGASSRWSIGSSRASARPTTSPAASPPSWSRCRRRRTSSTRPRRGAWSSSTRSAAARRRSTA